MPVIVFNKSTGKYLKRHSGSYNYLKSSVRWNKKFRKEVLENIGSPPQRPKWDRNGRDYIDGEDYKAYYEKFKRMAEKYMFTADPGDARVYATEGSATASVGNFTKWVDPKHRGKSYRAYKLPEHLEIHEIKESFVCVMRPDGSSNCDDEDEK